MLEAPVEPAIELRLGEAASEALSRTRVTLSRLHYAPSRKTILQAILFALPECCMCHPEVFNGLKNHVILKLRNSYYISRRESGRILGDLFTTPLRGVDLSVAVDFFLTAPLPDSGYDLTGSILKHLSSKQYLKGKNVLMFRLSRRLEELILIGAPMSESSRVDTWKSRYFDLSGERQIILQRRLEDLFREVTAFTTHRGIWPPLLDKRRECQNEARRLMMESQDVNVVSVILEEGLLTQVRKMSEDNFETAAIATLLWCQSKGLLERVKTS